MNLGVCYYPEHWDEPRWAVDARLLRDAGLSVVRMGEFAWSRMEPRPGEYELEWLDRAIAIFADENFQIVLGTPTAAPPAWLSRAHPETLPVDEQGRRRNFGGRRQYCPNSALYREYTKRIVFTLAARYGHDPRVSGWQIDNEFGGGMSGGCFCEICAHAFRVWLENRYGTLTALNAAWGTVFWSQEYSDWSQINAPILVTGGEPNPSQMLDYMRFFSDSIASYQQLQIELIRRAQGMMGLASRGSSPSSRQFITHNFMGLYPELDQHELAKLLTFVAWDSYPGGHAERRTHVTDEADGTAYAYDVGNPLITGLAHDIARGLKDGLPFWIMEQQAGAVNWGAYNPAPRPGVVPLWMWHNFAAGVETTMFFRERATWFAQEQYHSGLLNHDGSAAQGYLDLLTFREQHRLMQSLQDTHVENKVAVLISFEDLWSLQIQRHREGFSYWNVVFTWYAALQRAGVPCDVISKRADLSKYSLVIAPSLHIAEDEVVANLNAFAQAGGLVVLGIRSGFKTPTNLVTAEPLPGALRGLIGATVTSWQSLPPDVTQPVALQWRGWQKVNAGRWVETLETTSAGTIASYTGTHLDGRTAMSVNLVGNGRVMYCGWLPNQAQADALVGMLLPEAGVEPIGILPPGVIAGRRVRAGETFLVLMNFTDEDKRVWVNGMGWRDAMTGAETGSEVTVPARGVRVVARI